MTDHGTKLFGNSLRNLLNGIKIQQREINPSWPTQVIKGRFRGLDRLGNTTGKGTAFGL